MKTFISSKFLALKFLALAALAFTTQVNATILFSEDFEGDLSAWTGKSGGAHDGIIVADPLEADKALSWTTTEAAGETFTISAFSSGPGDYVLEYDYLGTCSSGDCGGFVGYSLGFPGTHTWLAGTDTTSGAADINPDTGVWEHVVISFSTTSTFHIMLEDFSGGIPNAAGDAFFDNIVLRTASSAVPEPSMLALMFAGLVAVGFTARSKK